MGALKGQVVILSPTWAAQLVVISWEQLKSEVVIASFTILNASLIYH